MEYKADSMTDGQKRAIDTRCYVLTLTGSPAARQRLQAGSESVADFFKKRGAGPVREFDFGAGMYNPLVEVRLRTERQVVDNVVAALHERVGKGVPFHVVVAEEKGENPEKP
jgi:hypothetical protein